MSRKKSVVIAVCFLFLSLFVSGCGEDEFGSSQQVGGGIITANDEPVGPFSIQQVAWNVNGNLLIVTLQGSFFNVGANQFESVTIILNLPANVFLLDIDLADTGSTFSSSTFTSTEVEGAAFVRTVTQNELDLRFSATFIDVDDTRDLQNVHVIINDFDSN